jgi:hypothetical protein
MSQPFQIRRGTTLPASLAEGEQFYKTDTSQLYVGPTGGGTPRLVGGSARFGSASFMLGRFSFFLDPSDPEGSSTWRIQGADGSSITGGATYPDTGVWQLTSMFPPLSEVIVAPLAGIDDNDDSVIVGVLGPDGFVRLFFPDGTPKQTGDSHVQGIVYYRLV